MTERSGDMPGLFSYPRRRMKRLFLLTALAIGLSAPSFTGVAAHGETATRRARKRSRG